MSSKVVWLDALTPKQSLLASLVALELEERGFRALVTVRDYDLTCDIPRLLGLQPVVLGGYGGATLEGKLLASVRRQALLAEWATGLSPRPSLHISFTSPEAARVAFGLGIPLIQLTDSPHSGKVNALTLPLADAVIAPQCVASMLREYLRESTRLLAFEGVFEAAWVTRLPHDTEALKALDLTPFEYCIVRPPETKAYYYTSARDVERLYSSLLRVLVSHTKVLFYPRYPDQLLMIKGLENVTVLRRAINMQTLERYALLVVTGGSTMAQESALMGTPSVLTFPSPLPTARYLIERGFPLYHEPKRFVELSADILREPDRYRTDTSKLLSELEDPVQVIADAAESLCR